jgi:hypothetical protein
MKLLTSYGWGSIILLHVIIVVLRILYTVNGGFDLDAEEAQYWLWSKFPDWSYYSKPPLIAFFNGITTSVLGSYSWAVRMNAILLGSFLGLGVYYITRCTYQNKKLAFLVSAALLLLPAYHYVSLFFTTDVLAAIGWVFTTYFFWMATIQKKSRYWLLAGLSMGLGLLGKYTLLYFIPFSLFYLLFTQHKLLLQKGYYIFISTGLFLFLPVIIWNFYNDMNGVLHITHLAGAGKGFSGWSKAFTYQSEYIGGQLLLNFPLLCLLFFWKKYNIGNYLKGDFEKYIISSVIFVFLTFFAVAFFKRIRINWLIFSYFPLYIILFRAILKSRLIYRVKTYLIVCTLLLTGLLFQPFFEAYNLTAARMVPAKVDPFTKLMGWKQLGLFLDKEVRPHMLGKELVILSDKYQIAAQMSFYTPGQPTSYCLPHTSRRMNQYDLWGLPQDFNKAEKQVVLIKTGPLEENERQLYLIPMETVTYKTEFPVYYKGEKIRTFYVYLLEDMPKINSGTQMFKRF